MLLARINLSVLLTWNHHGNQEMGGWFDEGYMGQARGAHKV